MVIVRRLLSIHTFSTVRIQFKVLTTFPLIVLTLRNSRENGFSLHAMFSLFGEFSNQAGPEVRDTMIGWSYDNFRLLERIFKVALDQRKTTLRAWLEKMANAHTPG